MQPREQQLRRDRADEREEHVPLRVPDIALRAEEGVGIAAADERREPLDELVAGAHREAHARDDGEEPPAAPQRRVPQQQFARDDRRHEALSEMPDSVVRVAAEIEEIAQPIAERHQRIGVMTADHQDHRVDRDQHIAERRQREPAEGRPQERHGDDHRQHLEPPGEPVVGADARPQQHHRTDRGEHPQRFARLGDGGRL